MSGKSSRSLPNSPRFYDRAKAKVSPLSLARQHSVALSNLEQLRETRMRRSKSCGEGRTCKPSLDFDLCFNKTNETKSAEEEDTQYHHRQAQKQPQETGEDGESEKFTCGACLFLPSFSRGKSLRSRRVVEDKDDIIASHRVSLEKFQCASWRSSAAVNYEEGDEDTTINASSLFFDLPVELMKCSGVSDTESPVTAGFVFDHRHNRKGVLKSVMNIAGKSQLGSFGSSRRVRFSTSSPASPRLRKDRDDFNAFLEAQSS